MSHFTVLVIGDDVERQLAPFEESLNTNPKWDWYQIGGRWSGMLKLKPGATGRRGGRSWANEERKIPEEFVDQARLCDIDWQGMRDAVRADRIEMWPEFERTWTKDPGTAGMLYGFDAKKTMPTLEEFIAHGAEFSTHAILKDGKWRENGEMGWFGVVHDKKEESSWLSEFRALLSDLPPETLLTIVDCHI